MMILRMTIPRMTIPRTMTPRTTTLTMMAVSARRFWVMMLLVVSVAGQAATAAPKDFASEWPELTAKIEQAVLTDRIDNLRTLRVSCLKLLTSPLSKDQQVLARYGVAYIGWRMAFQPLVPSNEQDDLLEDAVTQLEAALKIDDRFAEGHLLLGAVFGAQIGKSPERGMTLGGRSADASDRAAAIEPANPRVALQQGVTAFHTPAEYGGSKDRAEKLLRQSLELFEKEAPARPWPNWGRFDAHVWLGQVLADAGRAADARAQYEQALKIAPSSGRVRHVLLPALDKKK